MRETLRYDVQRLTDRTRWIDLRVQVPHESMQVIAALFALTVGRRESCPSIRSSPRPTPPH